MVSEQLRFRIARRIRFLAEKRDIPLTRLADMAGVSRAHLFAFLKGEKDITLGWLEKIAVCLRVEVIELLH